MAIKKAFPRSPRIHRISHLQYFQLIEVISPTACLGADEMICQWVKIYTHKQQERERDLGGCTDKAE